MKKINMRARDWVALSLLLASSAVAFWHGLAASASGNARKSQDFVNSIGVNTHLTYTSTAYNNIANVLADLQYLDITTVRDGWLSTTLPNQTNYGTLAAAGIKYDFVFDYTTYCPTLATSVLATGLGLLDAFVTTYPGSIAFIEGANEVNTFPICFVDQYTTSAATPAGFSPLFTADATLHFNPVPPALQVLGKTVYYYGATGGSHTVVTDISAPGAIDPGSNYLAASSSVTSLTGAITISQANEVLIAESRENGGPVTTITDTLGLTWHQREALTGTGTFEDEWYAIGPSGGSFPQTDTVTVSQTSADSYFNVEIFGIPGANTSTPFDGSVVTGTSDPLTITTSNTNTVVIGNFGPNGVACSTAGANYGQIGPGCQFQLVEYQGFSSAQSGLSVTVGAGAGTSVAAIADAVVMLSAPAQPALQSNTAIWATTPTQVVLNANAIGGGVGNGDTIQFNSGSNSVINSSSNAAAYSWQQMIYAAIHADANMTGVPVAEWTNPGTVQGILGSADLFNVHNYAAAGIQPWPYTSGALLNMTYAGFQSMVITENGYLTPGGGNGVDVASQAVLVTNILLDNFNNGIKQTFIYELMDEGSGCATSGGCFGFYDDSNTIKPSGTAIHNLTTILADSGSQSFAPGTLNYTVSGLPLPWVQGDPVVSPSAGTPNEGGFSFLLQKSNGHFFIVVWNEPPIYDTTLMADISVTPLSIPVTLGQTCSTVNVYDPIVQATPTSTVSSASSVMLSLGADPQIVECVP